MSDPQDGTSDSLGDLFDALPAPASPLPARPEPTPPAPGSRRARREAALRGGQVERAGDQGVTDVTAPDGPARDGATARPADDVSGSAVTSDPASASAPASASPASADPRTSDAESADASAQADPSTQTESPARSELEDLFAREPDSSPSKRKRRRGCLIGLIIVLVVLGGIAAGGAWVYNTYQDKIDAIMGWGEPKDFEPGQATGEAFVTIKEGDTGSPVSTALFQAGVTKTDRVFYDYLVDNDVSFTLYPGVYKLQKKMTAEAALEALEDPANRMANTVRIAEGSTVESSLARIAEGLEMPLEDLQAAVKDPSAYGVQSSTLDGWLFPAVYTFDPGVTAKEAIQKMVDRTREVLKDNGVADDDAQRVLTVASIIEREARTPDFAKVSRVIENRLARGMKLQMDSTAQYGYGELHAGKASTSKEAQFDDNPWNTYVITGLPKTPIANPGEAAIAAAEEPADGPWLYFVTVDFSTGETQFSETYEEHQKGIEKLAAWCKANADYKGC